MEAEVLIDAIDQITGGKEDYSSMTPEPYTFIPDNTRAIDLPDGSITSAFLELFGRPPRDTGFLSERNDNPSAAQRLHLLNSDHIRNKIMQSAKLRGLLTSNPVPLQTTIQLYLTILSRYPTKDELQTLHDYSQTSEAKGARVLVRPGVGLDEQQRVYLPPLNGEPMSMNANYFPDPRGRPWTRRSALKCGALATAALLLEKRLGFALPEAAPPAPQAKAKAVIQIWLAGGPPHLDTFDPKPGAGYDYCGPFSKPVETNVKGIFINELLTGTGQAGGQIHDHSQHDSWKQQPRDGGVHGSDRP